VRKVVTCNGCFDGLHAGHLFYLGYCAAQGGELVVGINSDHYIKTRKKRVPVRLEDRVRALEAIEVVSRVVVFDDHDPRAFIEDVRPDVHCIGREHAGKAPEVDLCHDMGIDIVWVPRVGAWSSTLLRGAS